MTQNAFAVGTRVVTEEELENGLWDEAFTGHSGPGITPELLVRVQEHLGHEFTSRFQAETFLRWYVNKGLTEEWLLDELDVRVDPEPEEFCVSCGQNLKGVPRVNYPRPGVPSCELCGQALPKKEA